jgi:hypothetical protein
MKFQLRGLVCAAAALMVAPAFGQVLYQQNFDVDDSANWTVNNGPSDEAHDFFFDYSTAGIPSAPNASGTTRGMKLQANVFNGIFSGMSVSPTGQTFTGDYKLTFDAWSNYIGNTTNGIGNIGATSGSSMLSQFGIMTSGTVPVWPGTGDGVWFDAMSDTSSTAYRSYSYERVVSYKGTVDAVIDPTTYDATLDPHNTYYAMNPSAQTTRSNNPNSTTSPAGQLYLDTFTPVSPPAAQTALYPSTQFGTSPAGVFGFKWHQVEIAKLGNIVSWTVDGVKLAQIDLTSATGTPGGTNILFGHSDINAGTSIDVNFPALQFTLIDDVKVTAVTAANDADFNNDNKVDGADFLIWQRNFGGAGNNGAGDANGDGQVNAADLALWQGHFGQASVSAVPEPATGFLAAVVALASFVAVRPRRRFALLAVK